MAMLMPNSYCPIWLIPKFDTFPLQYCNSCIINEQTQKEGGELRIKLVMNFTSTHFWIKSHTHTQLHTVQMHQTQAQVQGTLLKKYAWCQQSQTAVSSKNRRRNSMMRLHKRVLWLESVFLGALIAWCLLLFLHYF